MQSSWQYLDAILKGYKAKDIEQWERTREIVAMIYNKNNKRPKKAKDLIKLPTDIAAPTPETQTKRLTAQQFKELAEMYNKIQFKKI